MQRETEEPLQDDFEKPIRNNIWCIRRMIPSQLGFSKETQDTLKKKGVGQTPYIKNSPILNFAHTPNGHMIASI